MHRAGVLDHPDKGRKLHSQPIPTLGGVPIAAAMVLSLGLLAITPLAGSRLLHEVLRQILPLLPAAGLIFLLGVLDDLFDLKPWHKIGGQLIAASWLYVAGFRIQAVAGIAFSESHWLMYPLTIGWLLACTNAFNLIDGVDGLASGVGFFATITMLISGLLHGNMELLILTTPLAAALLAFLRFNFNPASIFLGDSGSLLIGFLLGAYSIIWSYKSATILGMTAPVLALSFPIAEAAISVARRFVSGRPIFGADRRHIHHRLLDKGLGPRQVAVLLYGIAGVGAAFALLLSYPEARDKSVILILFCAVSWIGFQHLGYTEFGSARRILLGGTVRKLVAADVKLRAFSRHLAEAKSLQECWKHTVVTLRELDFDIVRLVVNGSQESQPVYWMEVLHENRLMLRPEDCWTLRIPIPSVDEGYLEISRHLDRGEGYLVVHPIVEAVREVFPDHLDRYLKGHSVGLGVAPVDEEGKEMVRAAGAGG
jgi:UDP-GlcNAc:undecaprenyl-phosphate GlcNAc-1-phosphate transferase